MFTLGTRNFHSRHTRNEKPAPKTVARKWSRFMALVSRACVMGVSNTTRHASNMWSGGRAPSPESPRKVYERYRE